MLGLFRRILSRPEAAPVAPPVQSLPVAAAPPRPAVPVPIRITPPVPKSAQPPPPVSARAVTPPSATSTHVQVALAAIAAGVPEAISHKVPANPDQFVAIPVEKILPQLANGMVVMTAAELRECSPEYFAALAGHEDIEITLPLGDIVKQLSAEHFARGEQKRVVVPAEVTSVFAPGSQGVSIAKPAAPQPSAFVRPQPTVTTTTAPMSHPTASAAAKISMSPQAMAAFSGKPAAPATVQRPASVTTQRPASVMQPASTARKPGAPVAKKTLHAAPKITGELAVPLASVCTEWVDEVRAQLVDVDVAQSQIHVPLELLEPAMKSGKVLFSWQEVAGWIKPPLAIPPTAKVGEMAVELPLKTIAPLFMAHHRGALQKRVTVDDAIPDLFGGGNGHGAPQAEMTPAAPAAQQSFTPPSAPARSTAPAAQTESALRMAPSSAPAVEPKPVPAAPSAASNDASLAQVVGNAAKRFTAKEIVANTSRLPGVAGALLVMSDGLLVTSQAPAQVKAETIAAFIPQMFGRMNQYTKELTLGPLQELTLTVESGPWHVIKCNTIYFAVLGKRGESLPLNLLAQVAAELSSQSN